MPVDVKIPQLGESITEAEIVRWLKADGESVAVDDPLAEIETDKATAELPSPASGILQIVVPEGSTVKPGDVVARIQEGKAKGETKPAAPAAPDEAAARAPQSAAAAKPSAPREARGDTREAQGQAPGEREAPARPPRPAARQAVPPPASSETDGGDDRLSPAVRRLVTENHIDPAGISATGPGGRLTKEDVLAYLEANKTESQQRPRNEAVRPDEAARERRLATMREQADDETRSDAGAERPPREQAPERDDKGARLSLVRGATPASEPAARADALKPPRASGDGSAEERVRMSRLRRSIAQRLVEAQQTAAILTTFNEVDMSRVMDWRSRFKDKFAQAHGVTLGFMSFFARASVLALKDVPVVNARIEGDEIVYNSQVHLGIAASTDRGLVVPVVRNADALGMADLEREIGRLAELARTGRIGLEDLTGGTFTISNGGVFGSLMSTPILNPPQSAILGMHKIEKRPVVIADQIVVRPMMYLAVSYDHRLIDGREAVTFLVRIKERIEDPERLLLEV
jgi:2-oxoglutarate dehydrogenase E2 component (dihydrolipoamide succinyltransferase)